MSRSEIESRKPGIEEQVMSDIMRRALYGREKYGVSVADSPLSQREWLQHAYEEVLDLAVYLKKCINNETELADELAHYKRMEVERNDTDHQHP